MALEILSHAEGDCLMGHRDEKQGQTNERYESGAGLPYTVEDAIRRAPSDLVSSQMLTLPDPAGRTGGNQRETKSRYQGDSNGKYRVNSLSPTLIILK
jgi:hypothetical protein